MHHHKPSIFDINIRTGNELISLPIHQYDNLQTLLEKIGQKYPSFLNAQPAERIKEKVLQCLKALKKSHKTSPRLKIKINQFLSRCQTIKQSKILTQRVIRSNNKRRRLNRSSSISSVDLKQVIYRSKSKNEQFTKLYKLTKSIFCKKQLQKNKKQKNKNACKTKVNKQNIKDSQKSKEKNTLKQNQSIIIQRISNKLKNYETGNDVMKNKESKVQCSAKIGQDVNKINETEIISQKQNTSFAQISINQQQCRYRYNYNQIINERRMSERKLQRYIDPEYKSPKKYQECKDRVKNSTFDYRSQKSYLRCLQQQQNTLRRNYYRVDDFGKLSYARNSSQSIPKYRYLESQQKLELEQYQKKLKKRQREKRLSKKQINQTSNLQSYSSARLSSYDSSEYKQRKFKYM